MKIRRIAFTDEELLQVREAVGENGFNLDTARALHQAMPNHTLGSFRSLLRRIKAGTYIRNGSRFLIDSAELRESCDKVKTKIAMYFINEVLPTVMLYVDEAVTERAKAHGQAKEKLKKLINSL